MIAATSHTEPYTEFSPTLTIEINGRVKLTLPWVAQDWADEFAQGEDFVVSMTEDAIRASTADGVTALSFPLVSNDQLWQERYRGWNQALAVAERVTGVDLSMFRRSSALTTCKRDAG